MKPMFLGDSARKLYGVYHPPAKATRRSHAVLLCYPGVHEYNASHWAFRRLAGMLARDGHHVMRFDYFGTGDSAGRVEEGLPSFWLEDIRQAAAELKDISGARQVSLVGKRLGGLLAALACERELEPRRLVLWDPVLSGKAYVDELETWNARRNLLLLHTDYSRGKPREEVLGYAFPDALRAALTALEMRSAPGMKAEQVAIFVAKPTAEHERLRATLTGAGLAATLRVVTENEGDAEGHDRAQIGGNVLGEIASELRGVLSA
jgi:pimeloyl-ACP methyl ester carboxylesterase